MLLEMATVKCHREADSISSGDMGREKESVSSPLISYHPQKKKKKEKTWVCGAEGQTHSHLYREPSTSGRLKDSCVHEIIHRYSIFISDYYT